MSRSTSAVVHSVPVWLPITQTWLFHLVDALDAQGANCHVACERSENLDRFPVTRIQTSARAGRLWRVFDALARRAGFRRHDAVVDALTRSLAGTGESPVLHSHFGNHAWANLGVARRLGLPHVVTFYGLDVNQLPVSSPVWRARFQTLFVDANAFLCEGPHMKSRLVALGCADEKVHVVPLGIDLRQMPYRPRQWRPGDTLKVLIAASFREKKGIPYAIEALGDIAANTPLAIGIIGDAGCDAASQAEKARILDALARRGLGDVTTLFGYVSHRAMHDIAQKHHVFLQPSVTAADGDTEGGAPVGIIEMLATGMPVVASRHCDIPFVLGDAWAPYLCDERDTEGLAAGLRRLLDDADHWSERTAEARQHVERQHDLARQAGQVLSVYRALAAVR